jgi:lysozyme
LWQLSSDSRVKGIHPDVDVNVFNGYEHHWQEFLREETIK